MLKGAAYRAMTQLAGWLDGAARMATVNPGHGGSGLVC